MKNATKRKSQSEVVARARLRGPLNDLFDETVLSDGNIESSMDERRKEEQMKQRGRPPKKFKQSNPIETPTMSQRSLKVPIASKRVPIMKQAASESEDSDSEQNMSNKAGPIESYTFKLFGRRVDISKFSSNSPLYPICRAWFQNNPEGRNAINFRTRKIPPQSKRNFSGPELWAKVRCNEVTQLNELPRPCKTELSHIPPALPPSFPQTMEAIDEMMRAAAKTKVPVEQLLYEHQMRWNNVRKHWTEHSIKYRQERFKYSYLIFQHLQKRNKEQMMQQ